MPLTPWSAPDDDAGLLHVRNGLLDRPDLVRQVGDAPLFSCGPGDPFA